MRHYLSQQGQRLIIFGEKHLKTDVRYLVKGGIWLITGQIFVFFTSLLLVWIFANSLDKDTYGEYRFITAFSALLGLTALPGANIALTRSVAKDYLGTVRSILCAKIKWSLAGTIIGLTISIYYLVQGNELLSLMFLIISMANPLLVSFTIYSPYLNGLKEFRAYSITSVIQRLVIVLPLIVVILMTKNIIIIISSFVFFTIIAHVGLYFSVLDKYKPNKNIDYEAVPYAKKLSLLVCLREATQYIDKLIIWYVVGPIQVAIYTIALALPQEVYSAMSNVGVLALPKMTNTPREVLRENLFRKILIYLFFSIPVAILLFISIPYIFKILFPQYIESIFLAQLASLIILSAPTVLITQYFNATKQTKPLYIIQITEPVIFYISLIILVSFYGLTGAILAVVLKSFFSIILSSYLLSKN